MSAISTTQSGAPATSDAHSKSVGADGAIILTDHYLVEKLAQFNRERVPERVVHAKAGGAFGTFKATEDISKYTKAAFLQPGVETEMLIRFSSVAGENGSPDTWREMQGYGSHTYQWINAEGERFWVKYHFKSNQGVKTITGDRAEELAGSDADFYIRDLSENIAAGNFPSWDLHVQVMPYEDAKTYRFNPFDLTKVWPHADYPLIKVGTMELNRNPENYFAQIEQVTFAPSNFVPGIAASPDKMLQARIFSYADAHRYRVGTNHAQIPVNQPKNEVNNYSQDGAGRYLFNAPTVPVYAPNTVGGPAAVEPQNPAGGWENDGELTLSAHTLHAEDSDFGQAGTLYREVYDDAAKARFLDTITGAVGGVKSPGIKERAIQYWTNVDAELGANLGKAVLSDAEAANKIG